MIVVVIYSGVAAVAVPFVVDVAVVADGFGVVDVIVALILAAIALN